MNNLRARSSYSPLTRQKKSLPPSKAPPGPVSRSSRFTGMYWNSAPTRYSVWLAKAISTNPARAIFLVEGSRRAYFAPIMKSVLPLPDLSPT
jgi:hypothetical protein